MDSKLEYNIGKSHLKLFIHFAINLIIHSILRGRNILGKKVNQFFFKFLSHVFLDIDDPFIP